MKGARYEEWLYKGCCSLLDSAGERVLTALFLMREARRVLGEGGGST